MGYDAILIGEELKKMRIEKKLSIAKVAERFELSTSHYNQIELGLRNMNMKLLFKVVDEYHTDANTILQIETSQTKTSESIDTLLMTLPMDKQKELKDVFYFMLDQAKR